MHWWMWPTGSPCMFSQSFSCPDCGISIDEIEPRSFSFNNPFGACPDCYGLGYKMEFDEDLMIPDKSISICRWGDPGNGLAVLYGQRAALPEPFWMRCAEEYHFDLDTPFRGASGGNSGYADLWYRRPGS